MAVPGETSGETDAQFSPLHGQSMWADAALAAGYIYAAPASARRVLRINAATGDWEVWGPELPEDSWKWTTAIAGPGESVWFLPGNAARVLRIDAAAGRPEMLGPSFPERQKWHAGVLAHDGCIYAPPADHGQVMRIDCARRHVGLIGPILDGGNSKYCAAAVGCDGNVYCPPNQAGRVLQVDCKTKKVQLIGPDLRFGGGGGSYVSAVTGADGNVYAVPFNALRILKIDCQRGGAVEFIGPALTPMGHQWRTALLASDGFIYAPPCSASHVLKFNTNPEGSQSVEFIGPEMPCFPAPEGQEKWRSCVEAADGCIYAVPSSARRLLRIKTGACAGASLTAAEVEAEQKRQAEEEEQRQIQELRKADLQKAQQTPEQTPGPLEDGLVEEGDGGSSDDEALEDWPDAEVDGVTMWGPLFTLRWVRKNKFRTALASPGAEVIYAPPYFCGQILALSCDGSKSPAEALQMLGVPPAKPAKKVYDDPPTEDELEQD
eukprot:TRINITY_DN58425_c0_g1_i1.p1 TRINITY_DN58425_c0_g1~~TRINITY_DN58425_c0_g1_i1.p1  ORF type:complete len:491 (-),score=97.72 TRINITY_DN58425_c0_g1_i1:173-1645(-)